MVTGRTLSFCRICTGYCGLDLSIENDKIAGARGDKHHVMSSGFVCLKGAQAAAIHSAPGSLVNPLALRSDGTFEQVSVSTALDGIAEKLRRIIAEDGPDAVGTFRGTSSYTNTAEYHMQTAWMAAIGSSAFYSTMTIDQSAKWVTAQRLGTWHAGRHHFLDADVWMIVGANPLVSLQTGAIVRVNPIKQMQAAKARGMKLIVIDPRLTETARYADIFLQIVPGEDPALAAGLLHTIIEHGWHDDEFCRQHVQGFDALRADPWMGSLAGRPPKGMPIPAHLRVV